MSSPNHQPSLFAEFLTEIQIIILRHASHLISTEHSVATFGLGTKHRHLQPFQSLFRAMPLFGNMVRCKNGTRTFVKIIVTSPFRTRYNIMGISLLARHRQVALEGWREGVKEAPIEGCDNVRIF